MAGVVIIGAGHAGGTVAAQLRRGGFVGEITLIGDEPYLPYQRPPLSKAWLSAQPSSVNNDSLHLQSAHFYTKANIALRLNTRVEKLLPAQQKISLVGGEQIAYDQLILATGARPRSLVTPVVDGVKLHELRNIADAENLRQAMRNSTDMVIIGGGYIGLEVAASALAMGRRVTIVERESRVLARVASVAVSEFFSALHLHRGVQIFTGASVASIEAQGVRLSGGRLLAADCVLSAVGAVPNDELAHATGIACDDGILVDHFARTACKNIYAIGDVSRRPMPNYQRVARLESVQNAVEQAKQVAADICGLPLPAQEVPWFWSDQFDTKLQIAGLVFGGETVMIRGDIRGGKFAVFHLTNSVVTACESINMPAEFMFAKRLIANGQSLDAADLADCTVAMKALAE